MVDGRIIESAHDRRTRRHESAQSAGSWNFVAIITSADHRSAIALA